MPYPITVISDCRDDNSRVRVCTRLRALFPGSSVDFIGARDDLDAGGCLLDLVDALDGADGLVLVNAAPRGGRHGTMWRNGSPFGAITIDRTLVVTTLAGYTLSFAQKLGLLGGREVRLIDVDDVLAAAVRFGGFTAERVAATARTQFRSYAFAPYLMRWLVDGRGLPYTTPGVTIPELPIRVWWIDNFGNVKTTALPEDVGWSPGQGLLVARSSARCYARLADVPDQEAGVVVGSSGYGSRRFLEVLVRGGSAAHRFGLQVGDEIFE